MKRRIITALLAVSTFPALASDLIGRVYDNKTSAFLYQERHVFENDTMQSFYTGTDGKLIAERTLEFADGRVKSYRLEQPALGVLEAVERQTDAISIVAKSQSEREQTNVTRENLNEIVIDAGFSNFIVRNWDTLVSGERVTLDFVSIARMGVVRLQLKKADVATSSLAGRGSTDGIVMFNMNIANPLLRLLLKPVEVGYYEDTKQLAYYQGISNLKNDRGKQINAVHVHFDRIGTPIAAIAD